MGDIRRGEKKKAGNKQIKANWPSRLPTDSVTNLLGKWKTNLTVRVMQIINCYGLNLVMKHRSILIGVINTLIKCLLIYFDN